MSKVEGFYDEKYTHRDKVGYIMLWVIYCYDHYVMHGWRVIN